MRAFNYYNMKYYHWDSEILGLVSQIHEYKGRQELYLKQKPAVLDKLVEIAKIRSTEASNEIEGIVTTDSRLRDLYQDKTIPRNRDEEEILGYRDVLNTIHGSFEFIPIQSTYILQLHRDLYQYSAKSFGGRYKATQNIITKTGSDGRQSVIFTPLDSYETPIAIDNICESYNQTLEDDVIDPLVLIPIFILDFLCVHPFNDGNGRMSRLLTALLLYREGYVVGKYISIESKIEKTKESYYEVLEQSNHKWHEEENNPFPFIKYILGIILSAYRDFEERVDLMDDKLPSKELVIQAINQNLGKFTKSEIMDLVPSISRASIENALKQLVEDNEIERHGKGRATFYTRK